MFENTEEVSRQQGLETARAWREGEYRSEPNIQGYYSPQSLF